MNDLTYCQKCLDYSAVMHAALCFSRQMNTVNNITMIRHLLFTKKHLALLSLGIFFLISVFSQLQNTGGMGCC